MQFLFIIYTCWHIRLCTPWLCCLVCFVFFPIVKFLSIPYSCLYYLTFMPFYFLAFSPSLSHNISICVGLSPRASAKGGDVSLWRTSQPSTAHYQLSLSHLKTVDVIKNPCSYSLHVFQISFPLLLFCRFIFVKYFPIAVTYFPDIADPEGQL